jgi:plastocyanin
MLKTALAVAFGCLSTVLADENVVDVRGTAQTGGRPEPNAVVWLEAPLPSSSPSKRIVLDQRNLTFHPHVLAVRVGAAVEFPNNDRVFHNVFSFRDGKRFDLGMYPIGTSRLVRFDQPGVSRLFCNIHPNMAAYVIALETAHFAVTDMSGAFTIPGVPPGSHSYGAWRPGGPTLSGVFKADGETPFDIRWP